MPRRLVRWVVRGKDAGADNRSIGATEDAAARRPARPDGSGIAVLAARASSMMLIMAILAHLDLDAFFAAVEELEQPGLRPVRSSSAAIRAAAGSSRPRTTSRAGSGSAPR